MTDGGTPRTAIRVPRRLSRLPVLVFIVLLAGNIAVWSLHAYGWATQVRYEGPGQQEIDALREAAADDPESPGALLALAYAYQQTGRYDDALDAYDAVLELVPAETAALYNQATIHRVLGEMAAAEAALRAVLEVNPGHALAAGALGRQLLADGEYEDALDVVLPAAELSASAAELHYVAGAAHERLGETDLAVESYRRALQAYPDLQEAREGLERLGAGP